MIRIEQALNGIPAGLRNPLIDEYRSIETNFLQHRWSPAELSGGRFCEIVYTIIHGHLCGAYKPTPEKPNNFVKSCRELENMATPPRSFQILIPRLLPALYEVRNNRGVGHVGGDVDPNAMDAAFVMSSSSWIMSELIRFYHGISTEEASTITSSITELHIPLIWNYQGKRRILKVGLSIPDQFIILASMSHDPVTTQQLGSWMDYKNGTYLKKLARDLHTKRLLEYDPIVDQIVLTPTGAQAASKLINKHGLV